MNYNVVFHLDLDDEKCFNIAMSNILNFYKSPKSNGASAVLLVNGPAVKLFVKGTSTAQAPEIGDILEKGVSIRICQNALNKFSLHLSLCVDGIEVIPAGIIELIELQNKGFSYIKP